jgi:hypothetical protein
MPGLLLFVAQELTSNQMSNIDQTCGLDPRDDGQRVILECRG